MFGRKNAEQVQLLLDSARTDREAFAEQAAKDRAIIAEQISAIKSETNALKEAIHQEHTNYAEQVQQDKKEMTAQVISLKSDTNALIETMNKNCLTFVEQAEKDRKSILVQMESIKSNSTSKYDSTKEPAIKKGEEKKAAYALNLCTVSVSQIIDYNDLVIMEQEYDNILNNLNLQNFPKDESLLKILKQLLDVVSFFRIQDGEKKLLEEQYKQKVKNAIWSAIPSPSVILAGGKAGVAGLVTSAVFAAGTGYMNYRKERATIDNEKKQKDWELQKSAMEQFYALRRELFDTAWRLTDTYNIEDRYRLTERQISQYNIIIVDTDPQRRYERLKYLSQNFEAYPPFWYQLGHAAAEVCYKAQKIYKNEAEPKEVREIYKRIYQDYKDYALAGFDEFLALTDDKNEKKNNLLREDQTRAACALEKFALIADDEISIKEKTDLLEAAAKNSGNAFDTLQLCASSYLQIGETEKSIDLLRMLVNEGYNPEMNAQLLSMLYVSSIKDVGEKYREAHELLCNRKFKEFMFPWPNTTLNGTNAAILTAEFSESQNLYLFEQYKKIMNNYIIQSDLAFADVLQRTGDITEALNAFLNGIQKDIQTLFGDKDFAKKICDQLAEGVLDNLENCKELLSDGKIRREHPEFSFENISKKSIETIATKIIEQVFNIRNAENDEKRFQKIAYYMNNFFLFKAQTKLFGGLAVTSVIEEEKTGFEKLVAIGKKNQADQKFTDIIKKYKSEGKLIIGDKAHLITENLLDSKHVRCKDDIKALGSNKVLAYLDAHWDTDLLFTTDGIHAYECYSDKWLAVCYTKTDKAPYNSSNLTWDDDKKLKIGNVEFYHKDVDMKVLRDMIEKLSELAPRDMTENIQFIKFVGDFPTKGINNTNFSGIEYCASV